MRHLHNPPFLRSPISLVRNRLIGLFIRVSIFVCLILTRSDRISTAETKPTEIAPTTRQATYLTKWLEGCDPIPEDRRQLLFDAADRIRRIRRESGSVDLVFVCTHNSRRSQFAQFWAAAAADLLKLDNIRSHSCGTETTACNPRTVAALTRTGCTVASDGLESNPRYSVSFRGGRKPVSLFSKSFDDPSLPRKNFVAMICCDDADTKCPTIPGAAERVRLSYVDPKVSDDSAAETSVYDERCRQIACEMFALLEMVDDGEREGKR